MDFSRSDPIGFVAAAGLLRGKILNGEYPPGTQLPAEKDLCHMLGCGLDALRDALAVLSRELLIVKRRGHRSEVCAPPDRATIALAPGDRVTAWMPTLLDTEELRCRPEMPMIVVVTAGGIIKRHPADRAELVAPLRESQS